MAVFKCKMCGGDLNITEADKVVECEYCGTTQTVPSADNEKKMTLFNRANRLRLNNEFDKAVALYEQLIAEFPEEAEAYWGLCLCNWGYRVRRRSCNRREEAHLPQGELRKPYEG